MAGKACICPTDWSNSADEVYPFVRYRTYYDKVCTTNRNVCGVRGQPKTPMLQEWGPSVMDNSWTGCRRRCHDDRRCLSFGLGVEGRCRLYRRTVAQNLDLNQDQTARRYWDLGCEFVIEDFVRFICISFYFFLSFFFPSSSSFSSSFSFLFVFLSFPFPLPLPFPREPPPPLSPLPRTLLTSSLIYPVPI